MFLNLTNHPSALWNARQLDAALAYGEVVDIPFPQVDPEASEDAISKLAKQVVDQVQSLQPDAVLCQGEMTLCFAMVTLLKQNGIPVLAACSKRQTSEAKTESGNTLKTSEFVFCRFRKY